MDAFLHRARYQHATAVTADGSSDEERMPGLDTATGTA
ncbi:hypothetical protein B0I32_1557 [Nonomuraea fuscirosea]|uniref:Uncharacterized protein n=1 Tax=Nonomuraea fuscirosea TaxID=1291556 RepID=A0A2T0LKP9_9ACTN|nr:hypothetical protein B0I32_1557 [Nonomuraea fuscirosea]